jgi:sialate O-acetylesterase
MKRTIACVIGIVLLCQATLLADLRVANIFNENMVLQQEKPIRVWGWADPGKTVAVTLTEDENVATKFLPEAEPTQETSTRSVKLVYQEENAPAFEPQTRTATADEKGFWEVALEPVPASFTPKYLVCTSGEEGVALGNILIGEVWVCSGQSNMEWPYYFEQKIEKPGAIYNGIRYTERFGNGRETHWDATWYKPRKDLFERVDWYECDPETVHHCAAVAYWFAKTLHFYLKVPIGIVNNARGGSVAYAWCDRERLDGIDDEKIRTILANYDKEAGEWESSAGQARALERAKKEFEEKRMGWWRGQVEKARAEGKEPPKKPEFHNPRDPRKAHSGPAGLYNGVVRPIGRLAVRGVLWYQGENNAFNRWTQHQYTFPHVVPSFREAFGDSELPVGVFDLAGFGDPETPVERSCVLGGFGIIRDTLTRYTEDDPHAWLIPVYDVGHMKIHPLEKLPVGMRGARWALSRVYGEKNICYRGPKFKSLEVVDGKARITFEPDPNMWGWQYDEDNTFTPVTRKGASREANMKGFAIAGADRRWYPAQARRNEKERHIEVWSDLVPEPVAVRYGWAGNPNGNLAHQWYDNLPVPTFRTDDWPIPGAYGHEYGKEYADKMGEVTHFLRLIAQTEEADRKIRQAFVDIEKNIDLRFRKLAQSDPELKEQLAELKDLRERMEKTLSEEVRKVQRQRLGDSPHGIDGLIPGYTREFGLEDFRK